MSEEKMLARKDAAIGRMIFNNPEKRNAVSMQMWEAADRILSGFLADDAVRVIVLSGTGGKAFVSGADISKFADERSSAEAVASYNEMTARVYSKLYESPKPTVAMIEGACIGGGLGLAVCCDVRMCTEGSRFALPAAKLGLGYSVASIRRIVEVVGVPVAKDICLSGRHYDAREAKAVGLVHRVTAPGELEDEVRLYASTLAANAPLTIAAMKRAFIELAKDPAERDLDACRIALERCFASEDYVEGRKAFMDKRAPVFKGR